MKPRWQILKELIEKNGYTRIVEVGVSRGINACELLKCCPQIDKIYLVDISKDIFDIGLFSDAKLEHKIQFIHMDSNKASKELNTTFDLVFIDGDHSYDAVKNDISNWLPHVRVGGIICGHDYVDYIKYGVKQAVNEVFGSKINLEQDELENGNLYIWWIKV